MKHWRPDDAGAVPLQGERRRRRRDWTSLEAYAGPTRRPRGREHGPATAIGLALVAAACFGLGIGAYALLAPPHAVDKAAYETAAAAR